jgi:HEAT repeat protein
VGRFLVLPVLAPCGAALLAGALSLVGATPRVQDGRAEREAARALEAELRSGDKWERKRAVEACARLGTKEGWTRVVQSLADEKGEVADTAELLLAGIDARSFELLRGREGLGARDPWVRRRVAEALGRTSLPLDDGPGAALQAALGDPDPDVRRMALASVERLAGRRETPGTELVERLVPRVAHLAEAERETLVRARALAALAALDGASARAPVRAALDERDPRLRAAAARLLPGVSSAGEAEGELARLAPDPARVVRASAARALAELGTRAAVEVLVDRLAVEGEARLSRRILEDLRALSGRRNTPDPRAWRDWAQSLPAGWRGERAPRSVAPAEGATSSSLAGMPILSNRLAILVDLSGSIWKTRSDGRTKKEVIDAKLREALEGLPETTLFDVIPYTETPHPWKGELVAATRKNVEAAASSFEACRESGSGNVWDAVLLALEEPGVDTLLVLTDGVPTGGRHNQLEILVPLLLERLQWCEVALDSVLVEAPPRIRRSWEELARATGGLSLATDLRGP